ncbi:MAG: recombinase family protein [Clostridiales bacterium]|nr:recombinase family protein [Clostridiales bacterium]
MRNRMLPLGYGIENGEIVVNEQEAEIVKSIFDEYCNGSSLKTLVNNLNERNVMFTAGKAQWNKGRIHHILTDLRYTGIKAFPQIINPDTFNKAIHFKNSKSISKREISSEAEYLKEKVFCGKCGSRYVRIIDSNKKERWVCANGCKFGRRPTDLLLLSAIQAIVLRVNENRELLLQQPRDTGYTRTLEIMRLTNEIARLNEQISPSFNTGKTLLFQIAESKFSACKEDKSIYTDYVLEQIHNTIERGGVDVPFIKNSVHKVLITGKNEYEIVFVNGARISNKEVTEGASKTCNKDRRESITV